MKHKYRAPLGILLSFGIIQNFNKSRMMVNILKQKIDDFIKQTILPFVFKTSEQPMLFRELLQANKMFDDDMKLEGRVPGFRIRIGRTILVFIILWHIILAPVSLLFHLQLAKVDCHLLIIFAVIFTGLFFATYAMFKEWLIDIMAEKHIRAAWKNHFPHFVYDTHHREVTKLYSEAIEKEIPSKEMYLYILNNMISE